MLSKILASHAEPVEACVYSRSLNTCFDRLSMTMRILFFILSFLLTNTALANVSLVIKNENIARTKLLFSGFENVDPLVQSDALDVLNRIQNDLRATDLFEFVKQNGSLETAGISRNMNLNLKKNLNAENASVETLPDFEKYKKDDIGAIVVGQFNFDQSGNLEVRLRMWDVLDQKQLFGKYYVSSKDNYQKLANSIANEIYKSITGEKYGFFNSQILYISETGSIHKRIKKINLINIDGSGYRSLTDGRELVLTPIFSKRANEIFYLRYFKNHPQIFSLNTQNLRSQKIGGFRGTTFAANTVPENNNSILLSAIVDGNSDIYEMDVENNVARRLTKSPAIDTTPCYSPDKKLIAFSSDRDGLGQQIYLMNLNEAYVKRISSGSGSYSKPVWSPDGKLIAFTKMKGGNFFIGTMTPDGKNEKLLVKAYIVEGAKWYKDSRHLIYSKKRSAYGQDSIPRLFVIDIVTGVEFEVPTPVGEGATDPDWV